MAESSYNLRPAVVDAYALADLYLKRAGLPNTRSNRIMLTAWFMAESARVGNKDIRVYNNNPLNITTSGSDYHKFSGIGLRFANYSSPEAGADAWYGLLRARYPRVLKAFENDSGYVELASAITASPWGTSGGLVAKIAVSLGGAASWITRVFGSQFSLSRGFSPSHDAIDLKAPAGTPIRAVRSGTVTYARNASIQADQGINAWAKGGGNVVNIDAGSYTNQYAHMSRFTVKEGQYVNKGDIIGYVGSTGDATGPHLHFGVFNENTKKWINPEPYLNEGRGTIDRSEMLGAFYKDGHPLITMKRGRPLTEADVERIINVLDKQGWFPESDPVSRALAIDQFRQILMSHVGEPWNEALMSKLVGETGQAAIAAGSNPLGMVLPPELANLLNPEAWLTRSLRIGAILGGGVLLFFGIKIILNDVGVNQGGGGGTTEVYLEDTADDIDEGEPDVVEREYPVIVKDASPSIVGRAPRGSTDRYKKQMQKQQAADWLENNPAPESPAPPSGTTFVGPLPKDRS